MISNFALLLVVFQHGSERVNLALSLFSASCFWKKTSTLTQKGAAGWGGWGERIEIVINLLIIVSVFSGHCFVYN